MATPGPRCREDRDSYVHTMLEDQPSGRLEALLRFTHEAFYLRAYHTVFVFTHCLETMAAVSTFPYLEAFHQHVASAKILPQAGHYAAASDGLELAVARAPAFRFGAFARILPNFPNPVLRAVARRCSA